MIESVQEDRGGWLQTFMGHKFWPLDPKPEEIDILDIAHALSMLCRFGGHCIRFYSVAEHSVLLSRALPTRFKLQALLHDASEAYLVDMPKPIKVSLPDYKKAEKRLEKVIAKRFGFNPDLPEAIKKGDLGMLFAERNANLRKPPTLWTGEDTPALNVELQFWSPAQAEKEFLKEWETLNG